MGFIGVFFQEVFYRPLLNLLIWIFNTLPGGDFGVAIIVVTLLVRVVFYPLNSKAIRAQKTLQDIQPKIKEIQERYKKDKQKQAQELMGFYKKHNINPFSGILPILIQLPILIALFRILINVFNDGALDSLYSFVKTPELINPTFLGIINLSTPNLILGVIAGIFTFWQIKMVQPALKEKKSEGEKPSFQSTMQKQMLFLMPIFTVFIASKFAAGLALYWIFTTIGTIAQQYLVKTKEPIDAARGGKKK